MIVGSKDDVNKPEWLLFPYMVLEEVLKVLQFGKNKYGKDNWMFVQDAQDRYLNAAMRHLVARIEGNDKDTESNLPHLAHCICCLIFTLWFDLNDKTIPDTK